MEDFEKILKEIVKEIVISELKKNDEKVIIKPDFNKTTIDVKFDIEPSKDYKERVKAQVGGYTSKMEKENGSEKNGEFDTNALIYKSIEDQHKEVAKYEKEVKKSGLAARTMPDEVFDENDIFEKKEMDRLTFKNSVFLNEAHMLSKIPSLYKEHGKKFIMKDSQHNEYVVEWVISNDMISEGVVRHYQNVSKSKSDIDRVKNLFEYKTPYNRSTPQTRLIENNAYKDMLKNKK